MQFLRTLILVLSAAAISISAAQSQQDRKFIDQAHRLVEQKMEADWRTSATINNWYSSRVTYVNQDEVRVSGNGRVTRNSDRRIGTFEYDVTIFTLRKMAPKVDYRITGWDQGESNFDDDYYRLRMLRIVKEDLDRRIGDDLTVEHYRIDYSWGSNRDERVLKGSGVMYRHRGDQKGSFDYEIRFNKYSGRDVWKRINIKSNPWSGGPSTGEFRDAARQAIREKFRRGTRFSFFDETVGDVLLGNRTVKGYFDARGGDKPGSYSYTVVLGAGTGRVISVNYRKR